MPQHNRYQRRFPWALVYTTNTVWEAELVRGYLHARGIKAVVVSQVDSMRGLTVGALAIAKVYVPSPLYGQAQRLLAAYGRKQSK
ncbi:MAG: DUF2007 domain-containing protein [Bacteroidota bacterium]|nr:DUF2007 domain-containing protein [Candidatus Kapabacteria bacterium]MDW8272419.1 DUF2007 domain-containing protein [Bacteroidota bacterium]